MLILLLLYCTFASVHPEVGTASSNIPATRLSSNASVTEALGLRTLKSLTHETYLRAFYSNSSVAMSSGPAMLSERWYIESYNDKVYIKSFHNTSGRPFLYAARNGSLGLSDAPRTYGAWTPLNNGDGTWSFQSHNGRLLSVSGDGSVKTERNPGARGRFWLESWTDDQSAEATGRRMLKSLTHGTYLRAFDATVNVAMTSGIPTWSERWYIESYKGKLSIASVLTTTGLRFLYAARNGSLGLSDMPRKWGAWTPIKNEDGTWSFQCHNGLLLSTTEDGSMKAEKNPQIRGHFWLEFWTDKTPEGWLFMKSSNGKCVKSVHPSEKPSDVHLEPKCGGNDIWKVEQTEKDGQVLLYWFFGRYLNAAPDGNLSVDTSLTYWKPVQNGDGSWSFQLDNGKWLYAPDDDSNTLSLATVPDIGTHFWLYVSTTPTTESTTTTAITLESNTPSMDDLTPRSVASPYSASLSPQVSAEGSGCAPLPFDVSRCNNDLECTAPEYPNPDLIECPANKALYANFKWSNNMKCESNKWINRDGIVPSGSKVYCVKRRQE